jgi:hypothetical protein
MSIDRRGRRGVGRNVRAFKALREFSQRSLKN